MIAAAFGSFMTASALAAGVVDNFIHKGGQPHLEWTVFFFGVFIAAGLCCLAAHARGRA